MITRAHLLQPSIKSFIAESGKTAHFLSLNDDEWTRIGYLIDVTTPFSFCTTNIGRTRGQPTIGYVFGIYDELYEHLEECRRRLSSLHNSSNNEWVLEIIKAVEAACTKLDKYYGKTYEDLGSVYAMGTILSPNIKLGAFDPDYSWLNPDINDWPAHYEVQFIKLYKDQYEQRSLPSCRTVPNTDLLGAIFRYGKKIKSIASGHSGLPFSEAEQYLQIRKSTNLSTNLGYY